MCRIGAIWLNFPKKFASQNFYKSSHHVELPPNSVKSYYPLPQSGMGIQSFFSHKAIVTPSRDDPLYLWLSGLKSALNCPIIQQGVFWGFERRESSSPKGIGWPSQGLAWGRWGVSVRLGSECAQRGQSIRLDKGYRIQYPGRNLRIGTNFLLRWFLGVWRKQWPTLSDGEMPEFLWQMVWEGIKRIRKWVCWNGYIIWG